MTRPLRTDQPGMIHHVMNRGLARNPIFFDDADRLEFGRLLGEIHDRFEVSILAYCLMDNHYHLLVECPSARLSDAMKHLGSVYVLHTNDRLGRDGPMFRGRFRSIPVLDDDYLLTAGRYIHRNALDVVGVERVESYRWSSHRAYLGLRRSPDFLDTGRILRAFGDDVERFARFVEADTRPRSSPVQLAELLAAVSLAVGMRPSVNDDRRDQWLDRVALLAVADQLPSTLRRDVLAHLGDPSTRSAQRARRRRAADHEVQAIIVSVAHTLGVPLSPGPGATVCA